MTIARIALMANGIPQNLTIIIRHTGTLYVPRRQPFSSSGVSRGTPACRHPEISAMFHVEHWSLPASCCFSRKCISRKTAVWAFWLDGCCRAALIVKEFEKLPGLTCWGLLEYWMFRACKPLHHPVFHVEHLTYRKAGQSGTPVITASQLRSAQSA